MIQEPRLVQLFLDLCAINSPPLQERSIVEWMKGFLDSHRLQWVEDDAGSRIGGNANNLIVTIPGTLPNAPRVFLSAHFDTVEPTEGLEIEEVDGVFRSKSDTILGADDYAGMAPAIEAVLSLRDSGEPHGDIVLLLSVAEEIGLKGAAALDIQSLNLDFGYVLDTGPPVGSFVTRTANHDKLEITIHGRPAHAGKDPENGINAVQILAEAVSGMKLGRIGPETTANIGVVEGGTATNVVCARVKVKAEARSTDADALDAQVLHMRQCFESAAKKWSGRVDIHHARHYRSYHIAREAPVVQVAIAASRSLGYEPQLRTTLGGSDANVFNACGVPCIVVATGMQQIHTHDEHVSRADLVATAQLTRQLLIEAAKHGRNRG